MMPPDQLTADEQSAILAERYSMRAEVYDSLWSPAIRPVGERLLARLPLADAEHVIDVGTGAGALLPGIPGAASRATVPGVDSSEGVHRPARPEHAGPRSDLAGHVWCPTGLDRGAEPVRLGRPRLVQFQL